MRERRHGVAHSSLYHLTLKKDYLAPQDRKKRDFYVCVKNESKQISLVAGLW
jgi:hypothetical protein